VSPELIKVLLAGALMLHGVAHGKAFFALIGDAQRAGDRTPLPVRSWLLPSLSPRAAALLASPFWLLSTLGFILSSLSFWGFLVTGDIWRPLAVAGSIVSTLGIVLFSGIWPGAPNRRLSTLDTGIALVLNGVILVLLVWLQWPPYPVYGK
jgi:hypothetical protein